VGESDLLARRFEANRPHLRSVAYRMLGSLSEAEDAVQEAWVRLSQADTRAVENLDHWLTTVVAHLCLDMLRSRRARREEPVGVHVPDPIISNENAMEPEHQALLADSIGLAVFVVLDTLAPAERLAFVLHDMFAMPFDEIAPIVGRSPAAARQLASRARRRVQGATVPKPDLRRHREVVDAFLAACRNNDLAALVAVLDHDVVLRADGAAGDSRVVRGAGDVAKGALTYSKMAPFARPVLVNGTPGLIAAPHGQPFAVLGFTIAGDKITEIFVLSDPERLRHLDLTKA
jgi:RNA polymerase sigma factor (sigma-70 family)